MLGTEVFCVAFSASRHSFIELPKTVVGQFFKLFIIKGVGGVQKLPAVKKKTVKKNSEKKFFTKGQNGTRKWVVEVCVIICGVFIYCTALTAEMGAKRTHRTPSLHFNKTRHSHSGVHPDNAVPQK